MNVTRQIITLFQKQGDAAYFGEPVTQTQHALQSASLAVGDDATPALVAAALLHDIGHLLHQRGEDAAARGIDARHEIIGAKWLSRFFGPEITEPIRLHVAAKRYLCLADPGYLATLSPASHQSLALQGGPFSANEAEGFTREPHWHAAVQLRRWDEEAKIPGLHVAPLDDYREILERVIR